MEVKNIGGNAVVVLGVREDGTMIVETLNGLKELKFKERRKMPWAKKSWYPLKEYEELRKEWCRANGIHINIQRNANNNIKNK